MKAPDTEQFKARLWAMFPDAHSIRIVDDPDLEDEYDGWMKKVYMETGLDTNPHTKEYWLGLATEELFSVGSGLTLRIDPLP